MDNRWVGPSGPGAGLLGPLLGEEGREDSAQTLDKPSCLVQQPLWS